MFTVKVEELRGSVVKGSRVKVELAKVLGFQPRALGVRDLQM